MGQSLGAYEHAYTPAKARAEITTQIAKLDAQIADQSSELAAVRGEMRCVVQQSAGEMCSAAQAEARDLLARYKRLSNALATANRLRAALVAQRDAIDPDTDVAKTLAILESTTPVIRRQTASLDEARRILGAAAAEQDACRASRAPVDAAPRDDTTIAEISQLLAGEFKDPQTPSATGVSQ